MKSTYRSLIIIAGQIEPLRQRKFKSARLVGEYSKPWTEKKDKRMIWDKVFVYGLAMVGVGIGAYIVYNGWSTIENPPVSLFSIRRSCTDSLSIVWCSKMTSRMVSTPIHGTLSSKSVVSV